MGERRLCYRSPWGAMPKTNETGPLTVWRFYACDNPVCTANERGKRVRWLKTNGTLDRCPECGWTATLEQELHA